MPFGNNRAAVRPQATFKAAGGVIMKYRHPMLAYQIDGVTPVDEVDVSKACKLNETFFDANPTQDNAVMETLVDGSTITITNHLLSGEMSLQVLPTTGLVGTGDFIAALHLVMASKDTEGGTFTVIENIKGNRIVTIYYGVGCKRVPHKKIAGNAIVPYPVVLSYAGWVQGVSASKAIGAKTIWAVGNKYGISAVYKPYGIQDEERSVDRPEDFYRGSPLSADTNGVEPDDADTDTPSTDPTSRLGDDPLVAAGIKDDTATRVNPWPATSSGSDEAGGESSEG